jgi:hypothetical protein
VESSSSSELEEKVQQEDDEEQGEEEEAGADARLKVYMRGHSTLPERAMLPVNHPIIRPEGTQ